jgi:hypothetical protein
MPKQLYERVTEIPHTRLDGTETTLTIWRSSCITCGKPFEFKAPTMAKKFAPNRRCEKHHAPGRKTRIRKATIT